MSRFVHHWQKHKKKHKEHSDSLDKTPVISELAPEVNSDLFIYCTFNNWTLSTWCNDALSH